MKKMMIIALALLMTLCICGTATAANVAQGKTATQSSTGWECPPDRAVDGNTDGNNYNTSINHTNYEKSPWWQVDLGASYYIDSIAIWNRTDCCGERLSDFYVFVSDSPFTTNDVNALAARSDIGVFYNPGPNGVSKQSTINRNGRYVRIQLNKSDYLHMAEVQVFSSGSGGTGVTGGTAGSNVAQGKTVTQSSTGFGGTPERAVDGNTGGDYYKGEITHTNLEKCPWWQVDLGASYYIDSIAVWNRTDCCGERLSDYYVFVSDSPFTTNDVNALAARSDMGVFYNPGPNSLTNQFSVNRNGRYVRVQLTKENYLSIAEVQVTSGSGGGTPSSTGGTSVTASLNATLNPDGGDITVIYTGAPGNSTDWVGIYKTSGSDSSYISYQYLNGNRSGTLTFDAPKDPGTYNLRMFANNGYTLLATSNTITINQVVTPTNVGAFTLRASPGNGGIYLEWTDPGYTYSTVGYNLFRGNYGGGETSTPITDFPIKGSSYIDPNVEIGKYYCYYARPVYSDGSMGNVSNESCATPTSNGGSSGGSSGGGTAGGTQVILQIDNPYMTVNGSSREIDPGRGTVPIIYNGRTLLPIRSIVEAVGGTVAWDPRESKVTIQYKGTTIEMWIGSNSTRVNGTSGYTDVAPRVVNERTMLPLRFIAENLGADIKWDGNTYTVTMNFK